MVFGPLLASMASAVAGPLMNRALGGSSSQPPNAQANTNTPMIPIGGALQGVGNKLGDHLMESLFAKSRGKLAGKQAHAYYGEAFKGTNPWERLGAGNPSGQLASNAAQKSMQERELATRERIVDKQVAGQTAVARIAADAPGRQASVAESQSFSVVRSNLAKAALNMAQARHMGNEAELSGARVLFKNELAKAHLNGMIGRNAYTLGLAAMEQPEKALAFLSRFGFVPGIRKKFGSGVSISPKVAHPKWARPQVSPKSPSMKGVPKAPRQRSTGDSVELSRVKRRAQREGVIGRARERNKATRQEFTKPKLRELDRQRAKLKSQNKSKWIKKRRQRDTR